MSDGEIVVIPKKELDEKEKLINSLDVKCQKMKSDFRRYKERVDGKEEAIQEKVHGELARRLLSVADTLERAMNSDSKEAGGDGEGYCEIVEKMLEGTRSNLGMTYNQLLNALGVTPVAPLSGERFNDELHTAIETTPNSFLPDKTIVSLVRKGYKLNGELIRPAEVLISDGSGIKLEEEEKAEVEAVYKPEPERFLAILWNRFASRVFKRKFTEMKEREQELVERGQELSQNEEMLRNTVKELDAREAEFKKRMEEWTERKEAEESRIHELEQRKETLSAEFEEAKRDLRTIHENLNVLDAKKEKMVIESIALDRYNKELLAEKERLLNAIEEMERIRESGNAELKEIEERKTKSIEELFKVEEELEKAKELLSFELKEKEKREEEKSKELPFREFELPC